MIMETIVFLGATLTVDEAKKILPNACYCDPIQAGDILKILFLKPQAIVIIDGYFSQTAAVKHKEILLALWQGVSIYGASSMGALRAAELTEYGMRGYGVIYEKYKKRQIIGDDEVAIMFSAHKQDIIFPLINIRVTLDVASKKGLITPTQKKQIIKKIKNLAFFKRDKHSLLDILSEHKLSDWFFENYIDQKKIDAVDLLQILSRNRKENKVSALNHAHPVTIYMDRLYRKVTSEPFSKNYEWLTENLKRAIACSEREKLSIIAKILNLISDLSGYDVEKLLHDISLMKETDMGVKKYILIYIQEFDQNKALNLIVKLYTYLLRLLKIKGVNIESNAKIKLLKFISKKNHLDNKASFLEWLNKNKLTEVIDDFIEKMTVYYILIEEGKPYYLDIISQDFNIYWFEQAYNLLILDKQI